MTTTTIETEFLTTAAAQRRSYRPHYTSVSIVTCRDRHGDYVATATINGTTYRGRGFVRTETRRAASAAEVLVAMRAHLATVAA